MIDLLKLKRKEEKGFYTSIIFRTEQVYDCVCAKNDIS